MKYSLIFFGVSLIATSV